MPACHHDVVSTAVLVALLSLLITGISAPVCILMAHRFGVMDRPGPLKTHRVPVPYLGGVAVFAGLLVGGAAGRPVTLVPLAAALALGVADDRFELPAPLRLAAQLGVGAVIALVVPLHLPASVGVPFLVAATAIVINGFNLLDGLDMLAAGVGAAAALGFAVITHGPARLLAASLVGALAAFLWYNRPPARIYLGDGGSYLLGASVTVLLAYSWGPGVTTANGVVSLALLVVPVTEVAFAIVRRWRSGQSLLVGDRSHPYDLLVTRGWSRAAASGTYIAVETAVLVATVAAVLGHASMSFTLGIDAAVVMAVFAAAALIGALSGSASTPT